MSCSSARNHSVCHGAMKGVRDALPAGSTIFSRSAAASGPAHPGRLRRRCRRRQVPPRCSSRCGESRAGIRGSSPDRRPPARRGRTRRAPQKSALMTRRQTRLQRPPAIIHAVAVRPLPVRMRWAWAGAVSEPITAISTLNSTRGIFRRIGISRRGYLLMPVAIAAEQDLGNGSPADARRHRYEQSRTEKLELPMLRSIFLPTHRAGQCESGFRERGSFLGLDDKLPEIGGLHAPCSAPPC